MHATLESIRWHVARITAVLCFIPGHAAADDCWSLLDSRFGPDLKAAVGEADPCRKMKGGLDVTKEFQVTVLNLCTASKGVKVTAEAKISCKTGDAALFKASVSGNLIADLTVDVGACKITDSNISIGGSVGEFLSSLADFQDAARGFAQAKLTEVCFGGAK